MVSYLSQVLTSSVHQSTLLCSLLSLSIFGWAVKQAVNVIQVVIDTCLTSRAIYNYPFSVEKDIPIYR